MKQLADNPAAAPKGSPAPSGQAGEPGKSSAPQYVPSEVETYIPVPQKVDDPRMVLDTSMGRIKIRLFYGIAPKNVRNVADLARGNREFQDVRTTRPVKRPFYNGLVFHRILSGYLIQTGCPFGNGRGGPGYQVVDEINPALKFTKPGMVAMAPQRGDGAAATPASGGSKADGIKDSNGSQFFITLAPMPDWNEKFTIIGEVESGMDIVRKIGQVKTGPTDRPIKRVFLQSVDIVDPTGAIPSNQSP
jgi:peptidyl-prolyl cis-trans isomerase A (cyclophilin A)